MRDSLPAQRVLFFRTDKKFHLANWLTEWRPDEKLADEKSRLRHCDGAHSSERIRQLAERQAPVPATEFVIWLPPGKNGEFGCANRSCLLPGHIVLSDRSFDLARSMKGLSGRYVLSISQP